MGYAFISYSTKNQASADAMRNLFNKHSIDTWMAPYDIPAGSEYAEILYDALTGCSCLVLMLTDVSQNSQWVKKEVNIAITNGKTVVPIKLEDVELNSSMKLYLNDQQIVPVHVIDDNSYEIKKVLDAVRAYTKDDTPKVDEAGSIDYSEKETDSTETLDKPSSENPIEIEPDVADSAQTKPETAAVPEGFHTFGHIMIVSSMKYVPKEKNNRDKNWDNVTELVLGEGIEEITMEAFSWMKELRKVEFPKSLKRIGYAAFAHCAKLNCVNIPDGVTVISAHAFEGCNQLSNVYIPKSVKYIGDDAFYNCPLKPTFVQNGCTVCNGNFGIYREKK